MSWWETERHLKSFLCQPLKLVFITTYKQTTKQDDASIHNKAN